MNEIKQDLNTTQLVGHYKKHVERTYIGACDLMQDDGSYRAVNVTISGTYRREIFNPGSRGVEKKLVASFEKGGKDFIMNSTNQESVAEIAGSEMVHDWVGTRITLYVQKNVPVGKKKVDAIRVKRPIAEPQQQAANG